MFPVSILPSHLLKLCQNFFFSFKSVLEEEVGLSGEHTTGQQEVGQIPACKAIESIPLVSFNTFFLLTFSRMLSLPFFFFWPVNGRFDGLDMIAHQVDFIFRPIK